MYVNVCECTYVHTYVRTSVGRSVGQLVGLSVGLFVCLSVCLCVHVHIGICIYNMFISLAWCVCVQCHCRDRATRTLSLSRWFPSNGIQPSSNLEQSEQLQLRSLLGEAKLPTTTKSNFDFSCSQISSVQIRNKYVPIVLWQQKFRECVLWHVDGVCDENPRCERSCAQETDQLFGTWLRDAQVKNSRPRNHGTHKVRLSLYSARKNFDGAT